MGQEYIPMRVGTYKDKDSIEHEVFMIYRDGQISHKGARRVYFYDADKKPLKGNRFIDLVTFEKDIRKPWQSCLREDNRRFLENKVKFGEKTRKRALEATYARFLESKKARNSGKNNVPKPSGMKPAKTAKGIDLLPQKKRRKQEIVRESSIPVPKPSGVSKRRMPSTVEGQKKQKLNNGFAVNVSPKLNTRKPSTQVGKVKASSSTPGKPSNSPIEDALPKPIEGPSTTNPTGVLTEGMRILKGLETLRVPVFPLNVPLKRRGHFKLPSDSLPLFEHPPMKEALEKVWKELYVGRKRPFNPLLGV